jgi:hypothetical protein
LRPSVPGILGVASTCFRLASYRPKFDHLAAAQPSGVQWRYQFFSTMRALRWGCNSALLRSQRKIEPRACFMTQGRAEFPQRPAELCSAEPVQFESIEG